MSEYGVTENGFDMKRLDTIIDEINNDLSEGWGVDTSLIRPSFLDTLVTTFSNQIAELWETAQASYYAKFPSTATGINLDNAIQFGGVTRLAARQTIYPLHCTGIDGTVVSKEMLVGTDTNPQITLSPSAEFTITRDDFNEVSIRVSAEESGEYLVSVNGTEFSYINESGDEEVILTNLAEKINIEDVDVSVDSEEMLLVIKDSLPTRHNKLVLSDNLTTEKVTTVSNSLGSNSTL